MYPLINIAARASSAELAEATFKTEINGAVSFEATKAGTALNWDMGDGTTYNGVNIVNHVYADGTEKIVTIYADDLNLITEFGSLVSKEITEINFQDLNGLGGDFEANTNSNLTTVNMPSASINVFTSLMLYGCDITGALDLSGCIIQGFFRAENNLNLNSVLHSADLTQFTTTYRLQGCDITGKHDLSNIFISNNQLWLNSNPNLTDIATNPALGQVIINFNIQGCNINTAQDFTHIDINTSIDFYDNPNLPSILFKSTATPVTRFFGFNTAVSTLDLSVFTQLGGAVRIYGCPNLTTVNMPVASTTNFTQFSANTNPSLLGLDFSGCINFGGGISLNGNSVATFYTFPAASLVQASITLHGNSLLTSLDLSNTVIGGYNGIYNNPLLATLLFNSTSNNINRLDIYSLPAITSLDISGLSFNAAGLGIKGYSNSLLTSLILPNISSTFAELTLNNCDFGVINIDDLTDYINVNNSQTRLDFCNLTTAEVNEYLVKIDNIAAGVFTGRVITINNNSAPDGSAGGFDGLTAKTSLQGKGITVTTD